MQGAEAAYDRATKKPKRANVCQVGTEQNDRLTPIIAQWRFVSMGMYCAGLQEGQPKVLYACVVVPIRSL